MNATQMRNVTDRELLIELDEVRGQSPVISELCRRLEELVTNAPVLAHADCPVCQATLTADYDFDYEVLILKVTQ